MQNTKMSKKFVASLLADYGFTPDIQEPFSGIAAKNYDSLVGVKVANAYLSKGELCWVLSADMQSEGRNCLSTSLELIPLNASDEAVAHAVARFARDIDKTVGQLTVVRIYRRTKEEFALEA